MITTLLLREHNLKFDYKNMKNLENNFPFLAPHFGILVSNSMSKIINIETSPLYLWTDKQTNKWN